MKVGRSRIERLTKQYMKSIETIKRQICKIMKVRVMIENKHWQKGTKFMIMPKKNAIPNPSIRYQPCWPM